MQAGRCGEPRARPAWPWFYGGVVIGVLGVPFGALLREAIGSLFFGHMNAPTFLAPWTAVPLLAGMVLVVPAYAAGLRSRRLGAYVAGLVLPIGGWLAILISLSRT